MNNDLFEINAVILANGQFPLHRMPQHKLETSPYTVCCDGAANEFIRRGFTPDAIVGDGDSLSDENRLRYAEIFFPDKNQETNDLTKAINYLRSIGKNGFVIVGATGKREDHSLGNISLLMNYMRAGVQVKMYTDYGKFIPLSGTQTIQSYKGAQISIFNFGAKKMEAEGLKYPIGPFTDWWQGTLNEATSNELTIRANGDYLVFITY